MPKVKLASGKLTTPSAGRLNPVQLSDASRLIGNIGGINAPQIPGININAGNVQYTPVPIKDIQLDPVAAMAFGAANFTDKLLESAFQYRQRQDAAVVGYKKLELERELDQLFYGTPKGDGTITGGFYNAEKLDASKGYPDFEKAVTDLVTARLDKLTPNQKAMAVSEFKTAENNVLVKGSAHASSQLKKAEEDIRDQSYGRVLDTTIRDIQTNQQPNLQAVQDALNGYGDADTRATRAAQITTAMLQTAYATRGKEYAQKLANDMLAFPGVAGDPVKIEAVKQGWEGLEDADATRAREKTRFDLYIRDQRRAEEERKSFSYISLHAGDTLRSGSGMKNFIAEAGKGLEPWQKESIIQTRLTDILDDEWQNAKADPNEPGALGELKRKVEGQYEEMPSYLRAAVKDKIQELEVRDETDSIAVRSREETRIKQTDAVFSRAADDDLTQLEKMALDLSDEGGRGSSGWDRLSSDLQHRDLDEHQRIRLNRIMDNSINPNEDKEIERIEGNWEHLMNKPGDLYLYDIGYNKRTQLLARLRGDRANLAGDSRRQGWKHLQGLYAVTVDRDGFIEMDTTFYDADGTGVRKGVTKEGAARNYQMAKEQFNELMTTFMKRENNLAPGEAMQKALTVMYANPQIRATMPNLPEAQPSGSSTSEGTRRAFRDDHANALFEYRIPELPSVKEFGSSNIITYAAKLGSNLEAGQQLELPPEVMVLRQGNRIGDAISGMMDQAKTVPELVALNEMMRKHVAQMEYVLDLAPSASTGYTIRDKFSKDGWYDADTAYKSGAAAQSDRPAGYRVDGIQAEELKDAQGNIRPEDAKIKEQGERTRQAISPNDYWRVEVKPDADSGKTVGWYNRSLGRFMMGDTDLSVVMKELWGVDDYVPTSQRKQR